MIVPMTLTHIEDVVGVHATANRGQVGVVGAVGAGQAGFAHHDDGHLF